MMPQLVPMRLPHAKSAKSPDHDCRSLMWLSPKLQRSSGTMLVAIASPTEDDCEGARMMLPAPRRRRRVFASPRRSVVHAVAGTTTKAARTNTLATIRGLQPSTRSPRDHPSEKTGEGLWDSKEPRAARARARTCEVRRARARALGPKIHTIPLSIGARAAPSWLTGTALTQHTHAEALESDDLASQPHNFLRRRPLASDVVCRVAQLHAGQRAHSVVDGVAAHDHQRRLLAVRTEAARR